MHRAPAQSTATKPGSQSQLIVVASQRLRTGQRYPPGHVIAPPPQKNARRHHQFGKAHAPQATPAQLSATNPSSHSQRPPVTQWLSRGQRVASGHVSVKFIEPQVVGTHRPVSSQRVAPAQVPHEPPQPSGPHTRDAHSGSD
jgi:hypothetical protein